MSKNCYRFSSRDTTEVICTESEEGGITPTGEISITQNGTVDVTQYATANVNVASGGGSAPFDTYEVEAVFTAETVHGPSAAFQYNYSPDINGAFAINPNGTTYTVYSNAPSSTPLHIAQSGSPQNPVAVNLTAIATEDSEAYLEISWTNNEYATMTCTTTTPNTIQIDDSDMAADGVVYITVTGPGNFTLHASYDDSEPDDSGPTV